MFQPRLIEALPMMLAIFCQRLAQKDSSS